MDFETKIEFFIPKFYNLLLQTNGRKCKRKGWGGGRRGEEEVGDKRNRESKKNQKERDEIKCFLEAHGFSVFKKYQFISLQS